MTGFGVGRPTVRVYSVFMETDVVFLILALGPMIWISSTVWIIVRQVKKSMLRASTFVAALLTQLFLIAIPFQHHNSLVREANLSDFNDCANNQEYCDEFWELAAIDAQLVFFLCIACWVSVTVWLLTFLVAPRNAEVAL